jgi:hypothetical protein
MRSLPLGSVVFASVFFASAFLASVVLASVVFASVVFPSSASAQPMPDLVTFVKVTSLADSGPGTLRECVSQSYPRVCVFETSGRIELSKVLEIDQPDLIVAGQTAPSPGILITGAGVKVRARNVTLEHFALRVGDAKGGPKPSERDCLSVQTSAAKNVTLRNLSISWGVDENFSTYGPVSNVRIEDSIISEALYDSIHPKGPHSMGSLVGEGSRDVSFIGNLFAANNDRNVRWKFDTTGEMVGNVIYGWGGSSSWNITNLTDLDNSNKPTFVDIIGNVYLSGPSGTRTPTVVYAQKIDDESKVFMLDNIASGLTNLKPQNISTSRVGGNTPQEQPAAQTLEAVLGNAGSRPWDRNAEDLRVLDGVRARTLKIRNSVGQWPVVTENVRRLDVPSSRVNLTTVRTILSRFENRSAIASQESPSVAAPQMPEQRVSGRPVAPTRKGRPRISERRPAPPAPPASVRNRAWIRSRNAWRRAAQRLCCSAVGWRELRFASRSYPSLPSRCEKLTCAKRVPWRTRLQ